MEADGNGAATNGKESSEEEEVEVEVDIDDEDGEEEEEQDGGVDFGSDTEDDEPENVAVAPGANLTSPQKRALAKQERARLRELKKRRKDEADKMQADLNKAAAKDEVRICLSIACRPPVVISRQTGCLSSLQKIECPSTLFTPMGVLLLV